MRGILYRDAVGGHGRHDVEDGEIQADAEGQDENGGQLEAGRPPQLADAADEVLLQIVEPCVESPSPRSLAGVVVVPGMPRPR
jgi:hypothetical protein